MVALIWKIGGGLLATGFLGTGAVVATNPAVRIMVMGPPRADATFRAAAAPGENFDFYRDSRIFTRGTLNERRVEMMLDSGAGMTVVDRAYANEIGLLSEGTMTVQGAGGTQEAGLASDVAIEVGGLRLTGVTVLILDMSAVASRLGRPLPVILGRDVFENSVVTLDFQARSLSFLDPRSFIPPQGASVLPLTAERSGGTRAFPVSINGLPSVPASFDLGDEAAITISRQYWQQHDLLTSLRASDVQTGGVGGMRARTAASLRFVTFGGQTFRNVPANFNRDETDMPTSGVRVGVSLMRNFRMVIDYSRDRLFLTPVNSEIALPIPRNRAGLETELNGERLRVTFVATNSPAAVAGWRIGDEIVAINGSRVSRSHFTSPYANWCQGRAGTNIMLEKADGTRSEIVLQDYF